MKRIDQYIKDSFAEALTAAFGEEYASTDPLIRPADPRFGDYQANLAMSLAKRLKSKPREIAEKIIQKLDTEGLFSKIEIAGPGFINLTLDLKFIDEQLKNMVHDPRLGMMDLGSQKVIVDYSSPNAAKQMHVGHLRSTVIGDAIVRSLEAVNAQVIRQNHLGDWGTQFGMLIENLIDQGWTGEGQSTEGNAIADLNLFYQQSKKKFDEDSDFNERARKRVVSLQGGDEQTLGLWQKLIELSLGHMNEVYEKLHVSLKNEDVRGESFYNPMLAPTVEELKAMGKAQESDGAICLFPEGFKDKEGEPAGLIVQKSDGGFLYATTDMAAIRYRVNEVKAERIIYVTDARQKDHFAMVFQSAKEAGWDEGVSLEHVAFGMVLGPDKKPYKTRDGGTVELMKLLIEAEERAFELVKEKNPDWSEEDLKEVAHMVGVGAVKYADLSSERIKDYVFDWNRMLAFEGNTAPYLQYASTRVNSIFRKAEMDPEATEWNYAISETQEKALALKLLQFPNVVDSVVQKLEPNHLCNYLYDVAQLYSGFYENCPVLRADSEEQKLARLALCRLTSRVMVQGLDLLGIEAPERM